MYGGGTEPDKEEAGGETPMGEVPTGGKTPADETVPEIPAELTPPSEEEAPEETLPA